MKAKDYLEKHWIKNKIWTHLEQPKHQDRLRKCTPYLEGRSFIDIGCALGHSTNILKKFLPGNWSGLEFMQGAVKEAEKLFPDITFYYAKDFNFLPVCGQFDSVICSEVIEHVEDDKALINGLIDITKNVLVITTPNKRVNDPGHLRVYTEEVLSKLLNGYNFEIIKDGLFFYGVIKIK
ncbi:unnamed protein product [marine sediment metagenome]|uniref:Methyltransferase type 11 domain-containing protein n=1 Tax=marine sediment metagenome TaxID=412755 RepID=X0Z984_9ZZZZ